MRIRPWHLLVAILALAVAAVAAAFFVEERPKDILLGVGTNLFSSVAFFLLLEIYWERMQRANGKRLAGVDYDAFAGNVAKASTVRLMGTFIFPLTDDPRFADTRRRLLAALSGIVRRPTFGGIQILFLDPDSTAARNRAAEQVNYDVLACVRQQADTLRAFVAGLAGVAGGVRVEVRLTSRTPPFALFQTDDVASLAFYYRNRPLAGVDSYTFYTDTPLGKFVERTFDDLWDDPKSVPLARPDPDPSPLPPADDMTPDLLLADIAATRVALAPSEIHGVGVFATADIPPGTRDLFSPPRDWVPLPVAAVEALPPHALELVQRYCLHDDENYFVPPHGFRVYDLVVFLNHSSDPNLRSVDGGDYFETTRPIAAGEELTVDYDTLET